MKRARDVTEADCHVAPKSGNLRAGSIQSRAWCFTRNNYTDDHVQFLIMAPMESAHGLKMLVVGKEVGACGTPHLQGYLRFDKVRTFNQVVKLLGHGVHVERAKGSDLQNRTYCMKGNDVVVDYGKPSESGKRNDLIVAAQVLNEGGMHALKVQMPEIILRYPGGCKLFCSVCPPSVLRSALRVILLCGRAGAGKSAMALQYGSGSMYPVPLPAKGESTWMDGYRGERILLLDEFRGQIDYGMLLRMLDIYPMQMAVKGGFVDVGWTTVIITSNLTPDLWYAQEDLAPLYRRIHETYTEFPFGFIGPIEEEVSKKCDKRKLLD